jgi:serpin B
VRYFLLGLLLLSAPSCARRITLTAEPGGGRVVRSQGGRVMLPNVEQGQVDTLVAGNSAFALDLYQALRGASGNLFYSPHSISSALAMTYAGARGETRAQMEEVLHLTLGPDSPHAAFNALDLELQKRGESASEDQSGNRFQLHIVNALWGQAGYTFLTEYLDLLAEDYGTGLRLIDLQEAPESARQTINDWVQEETSGKIVDLVPPGVINQMTRLVLTNAIYFNAAWSTPFDEEQTEARLFHLLDASQVQVPMMSQMEQLNYGQGDGYQAVELPYVGDLVAMVVLLPDKGRFDEFESQLDVPKLGAITDAMEWRNVALTLPKFELATDLPLREVLIDMGMPDAFLPRQADFSGMDGTQDLFLREVLHKAFVSVDEAGTEAAAATTVVVELESLPPPPVEMTADRPFIFVIRDIPTGEILFLGRVLDPGA